MGWGLRCGGGEVVCVCVEQCERHDVERCAKGIVEPLYLQSYIMQAVHCMSRQYKCMSRQYICMSGHIGSIEICYRGEIWLPDFRPPPPPTTAACLPHLLLARHALLKVACLEVVAVRLLMLLNNHKQVLPQTPGQVGGSEGV